MQTIENSSLPTVGNIVAQDYRAAAVFKKFGIDFCCGGGKSVAKACADKGLDQAEVEAALSTLDQMPVPANRLDFNSWNLPFLADYIVNVHHRYVLDTVPQILAFAKKVAKVHGHAYPETEKIAALFTALGEELLAHLEKEERVLFPYIQRLWNTRSEHGKLIAPAFGSARNPIRMMEMEHETAGEIIAEIRQLSNNFTPPESACNTYRVLYAMLEEFEQDLHQHVHLENNILFPKAMVLEEEIMSN